MRLDGRNPKADVSRPGENVVGECTALLQQLLRGGHPIRWTAHAKARGFEVGNSSVLQKLLRSERSCAALDDTDTGACR